VALQETIKAVFIKRSVDVLYSLSAA